MSDLKTIRTRLLDEGKVEDILDALGCSYIGHSGGRVEAQLPERFHSNNKRAVQIKLNDSLTSSIRTPVGFKGGSIFDLVSFLEHDKRSEEEFKSNLYNAKTFICETLGWTEFLKDSTFKTKKDYVAPLKAILKGKQKKREIKPNPILSESVLDEFIPYPYNGWIEEGISYKTQKLYGVGFDLESKRITIPMRNRFGQLVGVKGRIMKDEDDHRKYIYLYRYQNRYEWFNFHFAHPYILMEKKVYIFEAEKSCMKAYDNGIYNTLAVGASEISPEQVDIIKKLGLDVEIILCYDKGITIEEIQEQAKRFGGRKIKATFDMDDLLGGKMSPIDAGVDIFNRLVEEYCFEINISKSID